MLLFFPSFQTSQYSKLEKADILEMTVKHLKNVQRQQLAMAAAADNTVVGKYRAGFSECAQEVTRYLSQVEGLHPETRGKLEMHLQNCLQRTAQMTETHQPQPQNHGSPANQQLHVGIPTATQMTSLPGAGAPQGMQQFPIINTQGVPQFFGTIQMVPGSVVGSDVTLLLPASQICSTASSQHQPGRASVSPSSNRSTPSSTVSRDSCSSPCTPSSVSHHLMAPQSHHSMAPQSNHQMAQQEVSHHTVSHPLTPSKSWPQMGPVQNLPMKEEEVWRPW